ncbi:2-amino-4-hydroxy-6-hydroxymethyldihydropteridine diphosphokinase [Colwellia sp. MB3u-70]|uniref:2-amino-4-hydroxy-6- hydroxymethyldihydropteridine diphosphokinase n=1 Tax=unclassified Colwellia TaxID=196834 RepID=UPI0015F6B1FC|nr:MULTISPECIES: 2-amino-4-hydroxy-6-hydroxymethyldihydropteridine diphosphokinase [unclassified Colwellia]MBA6293574.1 2-amino-4-hydroxy-6-hydroxymethyldihydropteridine diphosphokinase [Colwellia sp. MB3u-8]MBA6306712.1 2-amino-4-hydroxy-6-hydroxymethyldihydropteridine diphosphokinase [Colwellia sp. MB3u-70]
MALAYIGLGSNLADPQAQISSALDKLAQLENCQVSQVSSLYFSRPMGPQDQPDYMNAVVAIETSLSAMALLDQLQHIEQTAGRVRKDNRWGARVLDLDILLFALQVISTERLTIPHYGLKQREFVLLPLAEIAPDLILPDGDNIQELADQINKNGLKIHSKLS